MPISTFTHCWGRGLRPKTAGRSRVAPAQSRLRCEKIRSLRGGCSAVLTNLQQSSERDSYAVMENLGLLLADNLILTTHDVLPERDSGAGGEVLLSVTGFDFEGQRPDDKNLKPSPQAGGRLQLIKKLQPWRFPSSAFAFALLKSRHPFFATDPALNLSVVAIEEIETGTMTKAGLKPVDMTGPCPGEGEEVYVVTQRGGPLWGSSLHCCTATCTAKATATTGPAHVRWSFGPAGYSQQGNLCLLILASKKVQGRKGLAKALVYEHTAIPVDSIMSWLEQHRRLARALDISNEEVSPLDLTNSNSASCNGDEAIADADNTLMPVPKWGSPDPALEHEGDDLNNVVSEVSLRVAASSAFGNSTDSIFINDSEQVDDVLSALYLKTMIEPDLVRGLPVRDAAARLCESRTPTSFSKSRALHGTSGMEEEEGSFQEFVRDEHRAEAPKHSPAKLSSSMQKSDSNAQFLGAVKKAALDYEFMLGDLDREIAAQRGPRRTRGSQVVDAEMTPFTIATNSYHRSNAASEMRCEPAVAYEEVHESEDRGKPPWQRVRSGMSTMSCDSLEKMVHSLDLEVKEWVHARNEKFVHQELDKNTPQPSSPESKAWKFVRLDRSMEATRHCEPGSSYESKQRISQLIYLYWGIYLAKNTKDQRVPNSKPLVTDPKASVDTRHQQQLPDADKAAQKIAVKLSVP
eukprot:SM000010S04210  [mRNA]  locus=s10:283450:288438:- [translate_table: standard]